MAVEVPTPTGPARPDLKILETRIYRGPNIWSYQQADPPRRRPRKPRGVPDRHAPRLHRPARRAGARARAPHLLARAPRAASSSACTRAPGSATSPSTSRCSCRPQAGHDSRRGKTRAVKGQPGVYNVIYSYIDETVGVAGRASSRCASSTTSSSPRTASTSRRSSTPSCARPSGSAFGPSTAAILEEAASRDIPYIRLNSRLAGPARAGRARAADPRHDDVEDRRARGRHRQRQGPDDQAARLGRPAGAQAGGRAHAARRGRGGPAHRLPRRRQAARRQPRSRGVPQPAERRGGREGVRHRQGGVAARHGHRRVVRDRPRLPLPHRRRPDAGDRRARAGARRRRRHAHGRASSSRSPTPTRAAASGTRRC